MTEAVTLMPPRYEKFIETQMYMYYGKFVFGEIDYENVELKNEYEQLLRDFKINIGIDYLIDDDDVVNKYIEENESINENDIFDFIKFVKIILEKLYDITHSLKTSKKQVDISLNKKQLKNRENEEKQILREQKERQKKEEKLQEKIQNKAIKEKEKSEQLSLKEQSKLQKEKERLDTKAYNLEVLECDCGMRFARMNIKNHQFGKDHIIRMDALRWFANKHKLDIKLEG